MELLSLIISTILATTFSVKIISKKIKKENSNHLRFEGNTVKNLSGGSKVIEINQK